MAAALHGRAGCWLRVSTGKIYPPPLSKSYHPCVQLYLTLPTSHYSTLTVLFLINILFDYTSLLHPYTCDGSELLEMDLPCGRGLWQASSRSEWEREYALRAEEKQLTYGDLLKSRFKTDHTLDSWLEQLDDFGTLVMAAASLRDGEGGNW